MTAAPRQIVSTIIPAEPGWCVSGYFEESEAHAPLVAWALVRDPNSSRPDDNRLDLDVLVTQVVPVLLDMTPVIVSIFDPQWLNCEVDVHRVERCER